MAQKSVYQKMLEDRFYLYRPWIPICKSFEAEVIGNLELQKPVLDIGCGNALFGKYCFKNKIETGLDCDENALKEAKEKNVYKRLDVGDACALPYANESFGTVISICAIEHIPDLDKVLANAYRVLKKGGKFIFTVPSKQFGEYLFGSRLLRLLGLKKRAVLYGDKKNGRSGHLHIYESREWEKLLKDKNFNVESVGYIFPKEAVFLWSFFHSTPFKIIFFPFRIFRDLNIRLVDGILKSIFDKLLSSWIAKRSRVYTDAGGYILIQAVKP